MRCNLRTKFCIGLLVISLVVSVLLIIFEYFGSRYNDLLITKEELDTLISTRIYDESLHTSISFNDEVLAYDSRNGEYLYSLVLDSDDAYNPYVKINGIKSGEQIAICGEEICDDDIASNISIPIIVYTKSSYKSAILKLTTLPIIQISAENEIGADDTYSKVVFFDNRPYAANRTIYSEANIHIRGFASRNYEKKGYKVSLVQSSLGNNIRPNKISLLGMRQDDDWILYAMYNDPEKIRNVFSTNLWNETVSEDNDFICPTGTELKYVECFINGEYQGLYSMGYAPDQDVLNSFLSVGESGLFKKQDWNTDLGFDYRMYESKTTNKDDKTKVDYSLLLRYYLDLFKYKKDSQQLLERVDIENYIDSMLFINLIQDVDHAKNEDYHNSFLAVRDNNGKMESIFCPWDMDLTWGYVYDLDIAEDSITRIPPYDISCNANRILENGYLNQIIVNNDTDIIVQIVDRYKALRQDKWSDEKILEKLDLYEKQVFDSGAFDRNAERWPDGDNGDSADRLSIFKKYVLDRLHATDEYYERLYAYRDSGYLVKRSLQYKEYLDYSFEIDINDKSVLNDKDYIELFEYMGIDISEINDNTHCIIGIPNEGNYEYIEYGEDEEHGENNVITMTDNNGITKELYLGKDYSFEGVVNSYSDFKMIAETMRDIDRYVFIRFGDGIRRKKEVTIDIGDGCVTSDTTTMLYNFYSDSGVILDDFELGENSVETDCGTLSCFIVDEETYAYYLDGKELRVSSLSMDADNIVCMVIE